MTAELSDKCWDTIKVMTSSYQTNQDKSENDEGSVMAALMWSIDEEIEINSKLVRDVIEC